MRFLLIVHLILFSGVIMAIEEPEYSVLESDGAFELRLYKPMLIAQVTVTGSMKQASNKGFKLVADYIFGNNITASGENAKIDMTAPVTINQQRNSEKIEMTAPVTVKPEGDVWKLHFVMPAQYSLQTIPKPVNSDVTLIERPGRQVAVLRFAGYTSTKKVEKKIIELRTWLEPKGITPIGEPELARYNPPWTLPFWRRNEVMFSY